MASSSKCPDIGGNKLGLTEHNVLTYNFKRFDFPEWQMSEKEIQEMYENSASKEYCSVPMDKFKGLAATEVAQYGSWKALRISEITRPVQIRFGTKKDFYRGDPKDRYVIILSCESVKVTLAGYLGGIVKELGAHLLMQKCEAEFGFKLPPYEILDELFINDHVFGLLEKAAKRKESQIKHKVLAPTPQDPTFTALFQFGSFYSIGKSHRKSHALLRSAAKMYLLMKGYDYRRAYVFIPDTITEDNYDWVSFDQKSGKSKAAEVALREQIFQNIGRNVEHDT